MKKAVSSILSLVLVLALFAGCGGSGSTASTGSDANTPDKTYSLTVSGISGSLNYTPIYIAQQEGWFEEAGIEMDEVLFSNGPVQMESLSSDGWDIGFTGVGGVLSGVLGYDAVVLGATNSDNGTQYVFARNDSDIVAAGKGNNTVSADIYGDAASWKGKTVLCNTGTVLHYLLIKTLGGFGLAPEDVTFIAMDVPTAYSAFLAGEGDLVVLTGSAGTFPMLEDTENFTAVSSGNMADTGLMCNIVANKNSYADAEKYEAMKIFLEVYFKALDWMKENEEQAVQYLVDFSDESGNSMDAEVAAKYLNSDTYYTLQEACDMMNNKAEGQDYSEMEGKLMNILDFFIEYGNYAEGDDAKFLGHTDAKLLNEILDAAG